MLFRSALNPVTYGSGTNVKMLDYFAAGLPVVSTEAGARGLGVEDGRHYFRCEAGAMEAAIARALGAGDETLGRMTAEARRLVDERFDWQAIARDALAFALRAKP